VDSLAARARRALEEYDDYLHDRGRYADLFAELPVTVTAVLAEAARRWAEEQEASGAR
jgi:hypothetical protein